MTTVQLKQFLKCLRFAEGGDLWQRDFFGVTIAVDFTRERIVYPREIRRGDETTSHFEAPENFVVLECVCRLLEKGYRAEHIELERRHKLGRKSKSSGKADITVYGRDGRALLVIECKTWGVEYEAEQEQMKKDGGQLFSYWVQDRAARYLCLYASRLGGAGVEFENRVIAAFDTPAEREAQAKKTDALLTWTKAADTNDLVAVWEAKSKKSFAQSGIFEDDFEPYNPGFVPLRIGDLREFRQEDKGRVFNQFEEILRHNNISDRSNAFNRFISLILAKIADENRPAADRAHFQYKPGVDTDEELHERLQALYTAAMGGYLKEKVTNYSLAQIDEILACFPRQTSKDELRRIYRELKFFSNNEFAFKEVYNERLFRANACVIEEIVELFQPYRFRYDRRAQFLGEFFELMLESGYKQSEGQFFTPTPIARFLLSSLPLEKIVREKAALATGELRDSAPLLPTVIDYACGSGHFVTEAIEELQTLLARLPDDVHPGIKKLRESGTTWAGDYLCGIEKDYRLARTSQVACFMHGDGEARIVFGDGLEDHGDRLPAREFDVLVANPPYTIKDFKKHLRRDRLPAYALLDTISDDSDDIEVLFVERATQLLRVGGVAALILPSSILNNSGIYTRARKLLLQRCWLRAIVEFGSHTFGATGTNTVVLFLERRPDKHSTDYRYIAEDFIQRSEKRELDWCDSQSLLAGYVAHRGLDLAAYQAFLARAASEGFKAGEFYLTYRRWFDASTGRRDLEKRVSFKKLTAAERAAKIETLFHDLVFEIEADKFHHWMLLHAQPLLVVKSGQETAAQREFLGYQFSDRRGYKGLDLKRDRDGKPLTKLYDEANPGNLDKANAHLRRAMSGELPASIPTALEKNLAHVRLVDCVDFERVDLELEVNYRTPETRQRSRWPMRPVSACIRAIVGATTKVPETEFQPTGKVPIISQEREFISGYTDVDVAPITDLPLVVFGDHTRIFKYVEVPFVRGADGVKLLKPTADFLPKAFFYLCRNLRFPNAQEYTRHSKFFETLRIPVPPPEVQTALVRDMEAHERSLAAKQTDADKLADEIAAVLAAFTRTARVGEVCEISDARETPGDGELQYAGLEHVESGTGRLVSDWRPAAPGTVKSINHVFHPGEVLYGKLRPYLNKVWLADRVGVCSTELLVLRCPHPHVLKWSLLAPGFVAQTRDRMKGNSLPRLKPAEFLTLNLPWPAPGKEAAVEKKLTAFDEKLAAFAAESAVLAAREPEILRAYLE